MARTSNGRRKWLIAAAIVTALIALAVYLFSWNMLRPYIERRVEAATGRSFEMRGDLDVSLSLQPRITARDLVLGNTPWSDADAMGRIGQLDFTLDLPALFSRRVELLRLELAGAQLLLEQNARHGNNWQFPANDPSPSPWQFDIAELHLQDSEVRFRDPSTDTYLLIDLMTVADGGKLPVRAAISGSFHGLDSRISMQGAPLLRLRDTRRAYPLQGEGQMGSTRFEAQGTVTDPVRLSGLAVNFRLAGRSLDELYRILNLPLPPTPAYELAGSLRHSNALWALQNFQGRVGKSDLGGDFSVDKGRQPQFIKADLHSRSLDLKDLSGFLGGREENDQPPAQPAGKVLPYTEFNLDKLRAADADVRFRGQRIITESWPFDGLNVHLRSEKQRLRLDPLDFGFAGGNIVSTIDIDANSPNLTTRADITLKRLQWQKLFPKFKFQQASIGLIGGRAQLAMRGNSMAKMLGGANGNVTVLMNGGEVSKLLLRLSNLDIANTLATLLTGDEQVPVRCMVGDMEVKDGDMRVRTLILDTDKQFISGSGGVDLGKEQFDLKLRSRPRNLSLAALRGPILIEGTFAQPAVRPDLKQAAGRVTLSALLGGVSGPLAILPLLQLGEKDGADQCSRLVADAKDHSDDRPKLPSKPGKPGK
ncbi:AsmA family protein [Chitinimonas lacunae]|uniref:AsmA family protein n=1 Tax=Chitinimonas lacunae TaxID=1963018 RepID=A0ABV8MJT5_9NEIS